MHLEKEYLDSMTREELRIYLSQEIQEYHEHYPEIKNIDNAWELIDKEQNYSQDEWKRQISQIEADEKIMEMQWLDELKLEEEALNIYFEYHHEKRDLPYWKVCLDNLDGLL